VRVGGSGRLRKTTAMSYSAWDRVENSKPSGRNTPLGGLSHKRG